MFVVFGIMLIVILVGVLIWCIIGEIWGWKEIVDKDLEIKKVIWC